MNRKVAMRQRRRVNAHRRWSAEYVGETNVKYTCRTCGYINVKKLKTTPDMAKRMASYQNAGAGAHGICPRCTKKSRDELYPLPAPVKTTPCAVCGLKKWRETDPVRLPGHQSRIRASGACKCRD